MMPATWMHKWPWGGLRRDVGLHILHTYGSPYMVEELVAQLRAVKLCPEPLQEDWLIVQKPQRRQTMA